MQWHKIILFGLFLIITPSGCTRFHNETELGTVSLLPKLANEFQPKIIWSRLIGSTSDTFSSHCKLASLNTHIFLADYYGIITAIDVNNGQEIWSTNLSIPTGFLSHNNPAQISGGVSVINDLVYVGSELAKVYAIKAQNGHVIWKTTVAGEVLSVPVGSDDLVLIHTSNGMLQALNQINGKIKWTTSFNMPSLTLRGESSPAIILGAAIVGGDNGQVSAVTINQGQLIWQQRISQSYGTNEVNRINDIDTTPVVVNEVIYAIAYNGNLAALELRSGQIIWSQKIGSITNFIIDNSRIYLVDQNDCIIAVDTSSGIILWRQNKLSNRHLTSPVLYKGYIITGDSEGYLHWIKTKDGQFAIQQKIDNAGLLVAPLVVEDKLIVQARNGKVYAIVT